MPRRGRIAFELAWIDTGSPDPGFHVPDLREGDPETSRGPGGRTPATPTRISADGPGGQSTMGAMIWAKLFRARFSRLLTVPRLQPVISAISS